jgi:hypothetical protein
LLGGTLKCSGIHSGCCRVSANPVLDESNQTAITTPNPLVIFGSASPTSASLPSRCRPLLPVGEACVSSDRGQHCRCERERAGHGHPIATLERREHLREAKETAARAENEGPGPQSDVRGEQLVCIRRPFGSAELPVVGIAGAVIRAALLRLRQQARMRPNQTFTGVHRTWKTRTPGPG